MSNLRTSRSTPKHLLRRRRLTLETLEQRLALTATPLISEFVASNGDTLADGNGVFNDWIEIWNPTGQTINLAGWHLTDNALNLNKWTFPALPQSILEPGEYLVIFASDQSTETYVDPAGYLHTDFALSADGEYLALTDPNETIVHEFSPQFPKQLRDISYGVVENISTLTLIDTTHAATALVPTNGLLDAPAVGVAPAWTLPGFDNSLWTSSGGTGVGFDFGNDEVPNIPNGTRLPGGLVEFDLTDANNDGTLDGTIFAGGFPGSPNGEEPPKGLDNSVGTKWLAFIPAGTYYGFRFSGGNQHAVNAYTITSANDAPNRDPYSWTLSGSNDGINYTVVDTRSAQDFANRFETRLYQFNNSTAYEYYRFDFLTEYGATGQNQPNSIQMAEIELLSTGPVNFDPLIDLDLEAAWNAPKSSIYQRIEFDIADPATLASLTLEMQYDDGFVAYLNGTRVASANAPALPNFQSNATAERNDSDSLVPATFNLSSFLDELVAGTNVLAIHVLNVNDASPDMLSRPRLLATELIDATLLDVYMPLPTPGAANSAGYADIVGAPEFSVERGFYESSFELAISSDTPGAAIYYTTDGSAPTFTNGTLYSGPIDIDGTSMVRAKAYFESYLPSSPVTHTYIFLNDILRQNYQATLDAGLPPSWGSTQPDYGMDPDVIGLFNESGQSLGGDLFGGIYAATIKNDLLALPSLSIVMDVNDMFGPAGIYTNPTAGGVAWERATSVELINPDGSPGFQIDAGIRTHGGAFRSHSLSRKHSLRLVFKGEYEGNTKLEYPWFGEDAATEFDTIVLRMDSNDGYAWSSAGSKAQYARNEFGHRSQMALGQVSSHSTRVHLYINGVYWGIYNPVERPDASFAASYYGGEKEEWDALNTGVPTDGTIDAWNTLVSLSQAVSQAGTEAAKTAAYMKVLGLNPDGTDNTSLEAYLDAVNYVDYLLLNFYGANNDWPHRNWYAARQRGPESQGFVFHTWDFETALGLGSDVNTNRTGVSDSAAVPYSHLRTSLEFRVLFGDRVHRALFNDGALTSANSVARYLDITSELTEAIVAESARWGDMHNSTPYTKAQWQAEINNVVNFLTNRNSIYLTQLRNAGLYPSVVAPTFNQFGGELSDDFNLTMSAPSGTIWYTLDGSDPRQIGGAVKPGAIAYSGSISLENAVQVKARALNGSTWSALVDATFVNTVPPLSPAIGDYTGNGVVDGADHQKWSSTFGYPVTAGTNSDGNSDGVINAADYVIWRDHLGSTGTATVFPFQFIDETYTQNFDTFRGSQTTLPQFFSVQADGSNIYRGVFNSTVNAAADFTGIMAATSNGADHSLAWRESTGPANLADARVLFAFTNNTGQPIHGFDISYDVEAWVNGRRDNQVRLKYDVYSDSLISQAAENRNAFETDSFATLNPNHTPIGNNNDNQFVLNGDQTANRETVSGLVDLTTLFVDESNPGLGVFGPLLPGQTAYFRWQISNGLLDEGNRSALAIDNLSITALGEALATMAGLDDYVAGSAALSREALESGLQISWRAHDLRSEPKSFSSRIVKQHFTPRVAEPYGMILHGKQLERQKALDSAFSQSSSWLESTYENDSYGQNEFSEDSLVDIAFDGLLHSKI